MSESLIHIRLVELMENWVAHNLFFGEYGNILVDHPRSSLMNKPPRIGHYSPDLFVPQTIKNGIIIGEAKTEYDIENKHSMSQIINFLEFLRNSNKNIFIFTVPCLMTRLAINVLNNLQRKSNAKEVRIIVLDNTPIF